MPAHPTARGRRTFGPCASPYARCSPPTSTPPRPPERRGWAFRFRAKSEWSRWCERLAYPLATDPGGAFVAEADGRVIGVAQSIQRESLWVLSFLSVDPAAQGNGGRNGPDAGRAGPRRSQPGSDRRLRSSGGDAPVCAVRIHAAFRSAGCGPRQPQHAASSAPTACARAPTTIYALAAEISREQRNAPHTDEIRFALRRGGQLLVCPDRGFAVAQDGYGVWLLAARDERGRGGAAVAGARPRRRRRPAGEVGDRRQRVGGARCCAMPV